MVAEVFFQFVLVAGRICRECLTAGGDIKAFLARLKCELVFEGRSIFFIPQYGNDQDFMRLLLIVRVLPVRGDLRCCAAREQQYGHKESESAHSSSIHEFSW